MPSAFSSEGLLKKHALRGTSLASDPTRAVERGKFQALHAEATTQGWDREQMTAQLTDRYKNFSGQQQTALADIARRKNLGEDDYEAIDNPELNEDFKRYNAGVQSDEFRTETKNEWRDSGVRHKKHMKNATKSDIAAATDYFAKKQGTKKGWFTKDQYEKWAKRQNRKSLSAVRTPQWEERAGVNAQNREENRINAEIARINETYIPLEQNQAQREARLRSRMEMYNMFLGS